MPRSVETVPGCEAEVEARIRALDATCAAGVVFLIDMLEGAGRDLGDPDELRAADPDPDERCGLLDLRHEIYAMRIPGCGRHRLVVSIDRRAGQPCAVHGTVAVSRRSCDAAYRLAASQLTLTGRPWEPSE